MGQETSSLWVEPLHSDHDRQGFSCGIAPLDRYLRTQAGQDLKKRVAAVFILTPDGKRVAGYYTLSQCAVELDALSESLQKKLPKYRLVPVTLLGRFAVSREFQGRGLGEHLLMDVLYRSLVNSHHIASAAVMADAKDENAASFYRKYGFIQLPRVPSRMFLSMATVAKMFS